jgi:hypothetical protein
MRKKKRKEAQMINLVKLQQLVQQIAQEADEKRLLIFADDFRAEFPAMAAELDHCLTLPDGAAVLSYLKSKGGLWQLIDLIDNIQPALDKLHAAAKARQQELAKGQHDSSIQQSHRKSRRNRLHSAKPAQ